MHSAAHNSDLMTSTVKKVHEVENEAEKKILAAKAKADALVSKTRVEAQEEIDAAKIKAVKLRDAEVEKAYKEIQKECSEIIKRAKNESEKNLHINTSKVSKLLFDELMSKISN